MAGAGVDPATSDSSGGPEAQTWHSDRWLPMVELEGCTTTAWHVKDAVYSVGLDSQPK